MIYHDACTFHMFSQLRKIKTSMAYTVSYIRSIIYNVTSQATSFAVSVLHKNFILAQPHNYICRMYIWALGCNLNTSIYIPIYIYTYVSKLHESKYILYIHINMHI